MNNAMLKNIHDSVCGRISNDGEIATMPNKHIHGSNNVLLKVLLKSRQTLIKIKAEFVRIKPVLPAIE